MRFLLCAVTVALVCGAAFAYPSLHGPTGLVALPTAESLPLAKVDLALDFASVDSIDVVPLRATAGVGRGELWALFANLDDGGGDIKGFGGKLPVYQVPMVGLKIALGLGVYNGSNGDGDVTALYIVGSQDLPRGRATIGLMLLDVNAAGIDERAARPFLGFELFAADGVTLAVEVRAKSDALDSEAPQSVVVRKSLSKGLAVEAGVTNAAFLGLGADDNEFFAGIKYRLGAM